MRNGKKIQTKIKRLCIKLIIANVGWEAKMQASELLSHLETLLNKADYALAMGYERRDDLVEKDILYASEMLSKAYEVIDTLKEKCDEPEGNSEANA